MCVLVIFKIGDNMVMIHVPKAVSKKISSEEEVVSSIIGIGRLWTFTTRQNALFGSQNSQNFQFGE